MKSNSNRTLIVAKVVGQILFIYGSLAWLDGVVVQFTHPNWLPMRVSHLLNIRTDTFTIIMFFVSMLGFFIWRVIVELGKSQPQNEAAH